MTSIHVYFFDCIYTHTYIKYSISEILLRLKIQLNKMSYLISRSLIYTSSVYLYKGNLS